MPISPIYLSRNVRNQRHETSSFYCFSKLSLRLGANTSLLSRHKSSVRVKEFLKNIGIFVVDVLDIIL
jgi:hypothetical protein